MMMESEVTWFHGEALGRGRAASIRLHDDACHNDGPLLPLNIMKEHIITKHIRTLRTVQFTSYMNRSCPSLVMPDILGTLPFTTRLSPLIDLMLQRRRFQRPRFLRSCGTVIQPWLCSADIS